MATMTTAPSSISTPHPRNTIYLENPNGSLPVRLELFMLLTAATPRPFQIVSKEGLLIPLIPNRVQRRILKAMLRQAMAGRLVRLIILKARKS